MPPAPPVPPLRGWEVSSQKPIDHRTLPGSAEAVRRRRQRRLKHQPSANCGRAADKLGRAGSDWPPEITSVALKSGRVRRSLVSLMAVAEPRLRCSAEVRHPNRAALGLRSQICWLGELTGSDGGS
jgi:hypothetical protein